MLFSGTMMTLQMVRTEPVKPLQTDGRLMLGKEIVIDSEKCDGCGLCVTACHEGALAIVNGKAALLRRDFCDGLGDCLPVCPQGAIRFIDPSEGIMAAGRIECISTGDSGYHWPIQLALVPQKSDFFRETLVFAADCTAFVFDDFKRVLLDGNPVVIGCPKLDDRTRFEKIATILRNNPVDEVVVIRMEVPCCRVLTNMVLAAISECGRDIRFKEVVISRSGTVIGQ